jgi:TRAP-type C4-dicarboxylate transport system substrate-binding protein
MARILPLVLSVLLLGVFASLPLQAKPRHLFKIASLAPEGSVWVDSFKKFANEVTEKTGGEVGFRIYPGGVMGDDRAMYRKIRVGQLHGGGFTMTGISDIINDFRVMAIPFLFKSYAEVDLVSARLEPMFARQFADEGLRFVAMTEVGFVYTFSDKPRVTISDLQQAKTWAPSNDPLTGAFMASLGVSPIALSIPDVLSSLQTGLVNTAFNSLYGSIVLQWYTKAPYVTDQPYGYAYGVFLMSKKAFDKLTEAQKQIIGNAAGNHFPELIRMTRKSNSDSREVLESQGVQFISTTDEIVAELEKHRDDAIEKLIGDAFSREIYEAVNKTLVEHRSKTTNAAN